MNEVHEHVCADCHETYSCVAVHREPPILHRCGCYVSEWEGFDDEWASR
jgi:hypothetical protein